MARITQTMVIHTDDLTGAEVAEDALTQVSIIIGGQGVTLDLAEGSLAKFEKAVATFLKDRELVPMTTTARRAAVAPQRQDWALIRKWASEQGIETPKVGIVPKAIVAQYEAAMADA